MAGHLSEEDIKKIFERFPKYSQVETFVETGTFRGETVRCMKRIFNEIHTIELSKEYYDTTSRLESDPRIFFHHGDSVKVLRGLLHHLLKPTIFYLDAHFCHKGTAKGEEEVPLLKELEIVVEHPFHDLIIIDDVRLFGTSKGENWSGVAKNKILEMVRPRIPRWRWYWGDFKLLDDRLIIAL
jgi:hypothetical protein